MTRTPQDRSVLMTQLEQRVLLAAPVLVKDFPGELPRELVDVNGTLFFTFEGDIDDPNAGDALWRSDGTDGGTVMVASFLDSVSHLTNVNGTLFFFSGLDLWKSDGTTAGTTLVKSDAAEGQVVEATSDGGRFYYLSAQGVPDNSVDAVWMSDGTDAGTKAVITVVDSPDTNPDVWRSDTITGLASSGGAAYIFRTVDWGILGGGDGAYLSVLKHDGTGDEPVAIGQAGNYENGFYGAADVNGTLYFMSAGGIDIRLRKTNGQALTDVVGIASYASTDPGELTNVNGILYFVAESNGNRAIWRTDGTENGPTLVKEIPFQLAPHDLTNAAGTLYFIVDDQLWKSDGSTAGTVELTDVAVSDIAAVNGRLFLASDGQLSTFGQVVSITGTAGNDRVGFAINGENLEAYLNGQIVQNLPLVEVAAVEIRTGDGDDVIDCSVVPVPVYVSGGGGNDRIAGGTSRDLLTGGAGKDTLDGGLGNDRLNGHGGHDRLFGNAGGDRLYGYDGNDMLDGGSSGDRFYPGAGTDTCYGQSGTDTFFVKDNETDHLFGGKDKDTAEVDATDVLASIESTN